MSKDPKYPSSPDDMKLIEWIGFCRMYGADLDARQGELDEMPDGLLKELEIAEYNLDKAYAQIAYFSGISLQAAENKHKVGEALSIHNEHFSKVFDIPIPIVPAMLYQWNSDTWVLPPCEVIPQSKMTFGEFIDGKILIQNAKVRNHNKWHLLHQVAAIFLRKENEPYADEFLSEDENSRLRMMGNISIRMALEVGEWFEQFNKYLQEHFTVFSDSPIKSGAYTKKHFEQWGWVNFLTSLAKTKVFDIPNSGLNSIECVRKAPLFDVLIYASQEKDYNEATYADMEAANRK